MLGTHSSPSVSDVEILKVVSYLTVHNIQPLLFHCSESSGETLPTVQDVQAPHFASHPTFFRCDADDLRINVCGLSLEAMQKAMRRELVNQAGVAICTSRDRFHGRIREDWVFRSRPTHVVFDVALDLIPVQRLDVVTQQEPLCKRTVMVER